MKLSIEKVKQAVQISVETDEKFAGIEHEPRQQTTVSITPQQAQMLATMLNTAASATAFAFSIDLK